MRLPPVPHRIFLRGASPSRVAASLSLSLSPSSRAIEGPKDVRTGGTFRKGLAAPARCRYTFPRRADTPRKVRRFTAGLLLPLVTALCYLELALSSAPSCLLLTSFLLVSLFSLILLYYAALHIYLFKSSSVFYNMNKLAICILIFLCKCGMLALNLPKLLILLTHLSYANGL